MELQGIGASKGIAIAKAFIKKDIEIKIEPTLIQDIEAEKRKFEEAVEVATAELKALYEHALENVGEEEAQIFEVHQMLVQDLDLQDQVMEHITQNKNVAYAIDEASKTLSAMFLAMEDAYLRERAADIKDISKRLLGIVTNNREKSLGEIKEPTIVIAKDLYPSDTVQINKQYVLGFITEEGGKMSHSAILARTMQIPAVVGLPNVLEQVQEGEMLILDGGEGKVYKEPSTKQIQEWEEKKAVYDAYLLELKTLKGTKNQTLDGKEIELVANIGNPLDLPMVLENDAQGIGLFRSEFLYMDSQQMPTEEEQFIAYKKVLETMSGKVIIRTLDVGGDKSIPYLNIPKEENPFLGYRAIRVCLDQPELFKVQLRALYRASAYGKLAIMFPMIATVNELIAAKEVAKEVQQELKEENIPFSEDVEIGIMIETPAAVMVSDLLAKEADFFSIGTNDLTQYMLAVDRMNRKIAHLYNTHDPAVLRAIEMVTKNAHEEGIWVGICGEAGADTSLTEFFIGIGIDELSVSPGAVLEVRKKIQSIDSTVAKEKYSHK
jgi:phosphotransferase system enzyme I (PtsI)